MMSQDRSPFIWLVDHTEDQSQKDTIPRQAAMAVSHVLRILSQNS